MSPLWSRSVAPNPSPASAAASAAPEEEGTRIPASETGVWSSVKELPPWEAAETREGGPVPAPGARLRLHPDPSFRSARSARSGKLSASGTRPRLHLLAVQPQARVYTVSPASGLLEGASVMGPRLHRLSSGKYPGLPTSALGIRLDHPRIRRRLGGTTCAGLHRLGSPGSPEMLRLEGRACTTCGSGDPSECRPGRDPAEPLRVAGARGRPPVPSAAKSPGLLTWPAPSRCSPGCAAASLTHFTVPSMAKENVVNPPAATTTRPRDRPVATGLQAS
ncbi:hypothetical protein P7K49_002421 [Saguinus oedipus]|uniref:Uncharacterized protein n=1 Tax=Saguinus oedipus TaxID=9490 RepID=A0ABQ9WHV9_SAGOE|nr:hypothetical protein P7K49_002421 [Saguinus oedipus]